MPNNCFLQARLTVHWFLRGATGALQKLEPLGGHTMIVLLLAAETYEYTTGEWVFALVFRLLAILFLIVMGVAGYVWLRRSSRMYSAYIEAARENLKAVRENTEALRDIASAIREVKRNE